MSESKCSFRNTIFWANILLTLQFNLIWYMTPVFLIIFSVLQINVWRSGEWEASYTPVLCLISATFLCSLAAYLLFVFFYRRFGFHHAIIFLLIFDILHSLFWLSLGIPFTFVRLLCPMLICILLLRMNKAPDHQTICIRWGYFSHSNSRLQGKKKTKRLLLFAFLLFGITVFLGNFGIDRFIKVIYAGENRHMCQGKMGQILLAMRNYQDRYGTLPPACTTDSQGRPLHSWRVLILPFSPHIKYMDWDYQQIRLNEPWNSEWNSQFHDKDNCYRCYSAQGCNYSVITGPNTFFPAAAPVKLREQDENKILLVERSQAFCWMDPDQDIKLPAGPISINQTPDGIGSRHLNRGAHIGFADGTVRFLNGDLKQEDFIRSE